MGLVFIHITVFYVGIFFKEVPFCLTAGSSSDSVQFQDICEIQRNVRRGVRGNILPIQLC